MASSKKTKHYNLSQYIGTDKPTYLQDYNHDMLNIDTAMWANHSTYTMAVKAINDEAINRENADADLRKRTDANAAAIEDVQNTTGEMNQQIVGIKQDYDQIHHEVVGIQNEQTELQNIVDTLTDDFNNLGAPTLVQREHIVVLYDTRAVSEWRSALINVLPYPNNNVHFATGQYSLADGSALTTLQQAFASGGLLSDVPMDRVTRVVLTFGVNEDLNTTSETYYPFCDAIVNWCNQNLPNAMLIPMYNLVNRWGASCSALVAACDRIASTKMGFRLAGQEYFRYVDNFSSQMAQIVKSGILLENYTVGAPFYFSVENIMINGGWTKLKVELRCTNDGIILPNNGWTVISNTTALPTKDGYQKLLTFNCTSPIFTKTIPQKLSDGSPMYTLAESLGEHTGGAFRDFNLGGLYVVVDGYDSNTKNFSHSVYLNIAGVAPNNTTFYFNSFRNAVFLPIM